MNADPEVMRYFPSPLTSAQSAELFRKLDVSFDAEGVGLLAVERKQTGEFIGCVGLQRPTFEAPFTPCVEIAWRLMKAHWGLGLAPEAAGMVSRWGFEALGLDEIVSFTYEGNSASRRVMEKLGMTRDASEDFDHPRLPPGHRLRPHVLYRMKRARFLEREAE